MKRLTKNNKKNQDDDQVTTLGFDLILIRQTNSNKATFNPIDL